MPTATPVIEETSTVVGPDGQAQEVTASADLTQEYTRAAFGTYDFLDSQGRPARTLSTAVDDIQRDFGAHVYQYHMMHDPEMVANVETLAMAVLSQPFEPVESRKPGQEGHDIAVQLRDEMKYNLARCEHPFDQTLMELVKRAVTMGHGLGEIVIELDPVSEKYVLRDVKPKPHEASTFVVDDFNNWLGQLPNKPGYAYTIPLDGAAPFNIEDTSRLLAPEKFLLLSNDPQNCDPRGQSRLRACYYPWWFKEQAYSEWLKWLARFGSGSVVGKVRANAPPKRTDQDGNPLPKPIDAATAMNTELQKWRNGSIITVVAGDEVDILQAEGEGTVFERAVGHADAKITKRILLQNLATSEGKFSSRAQASVHQDVMGLLLAYYKWWVITAVRRCVFSLLVTLNYGPEYLQYLPDATLGETEKQDRAALLTAIGQFANTIPVYNSQLPGIYKLGALPPAVELEDDPPLGLAQTAAQKAKADAAQAMENANPAPPDQGQGSQDNADQGGDGEGE